VGEKPIPAVAVVPVPVSATVCGDPAALSVTTIVALNEAAESGVNFTAIVQLPPTSTALPQLLVCEKSGGLVPPTAMDTVRVAVPGFESVTFCVALEPTNTLPKAIEPGDKLIAGVPVPPLQGEPVISGCG
jgi:hypothetical protein